MKLNMDGIADVGDDESQAEKQFEEILRKLPQYGKNEKTPYQENQRTAHLTRENKR